MYLFCMLFLYFRRINDFYHKLLDYSEKKNNTFFSSAKCMEGQCLRLPPIIMLMVNFKKYEEINL